jgi:hypothetical protein
MVWYKLTLNIVEFLFAFKVGCHVVEICNLITKFVQEIVFLILVDVAVTTWLNVTAWWIAWIAWVLFISITRVRLAWAYVTIMDVLTNNTNVLLDLLFVELINWVIAIIATATNFTFNHIWATKQNNWHILDIVLSKFIESISHVSFSRNSASVVGQRNWSRLRNERGLI